MAAVSRSSHHVPSVPELRRQLWRLAFPSTPIDDQSSLGDLFEVASNRAKNNTDDMLSDLLKIDAQQSPERFATWFSMPWRRHYTLNIDDLDEAIAAHHNLPRAIRAISALSSSFPTGTDLLSVHLNGKIAEYPDVTFSIRQYGQRAAQPDAWYQILVADIINHPVLFVGTALEELGLWQYIELRRKRGAADLEMRPPGYLVSPNLPAARVALLKSFNINWIQATEEEFYDEVLKGASREADTGHAELRRRYQTGQGTRIRPLSELRQLRPTVDLSLFLLGRTPIWADILEGYAVERWFEKDLLSDANSGSFQILLITGTAACGKSATAMRLALALEASERKVFVLDTSEGVLNVGQVVRAVRATDADTVLIDDVDVFGPATPRLLREIAAIPSRPLVIAAIRSSRLQGLDITEELADLSFHEVAVPSLHSRDIDALIGALSSANRLGRLAGMTAYQRREVFTSQAGKQLLVAMYYATSGERLRDKVYSECEDLSGASRLAYGMTALATAERQWISRDEILLGLNALGPSAPGNVELNLVEDLINRNLVVRDGQSLTVRHRWIAETALEFYIENGLVGGVIKAFAFVLAVKIDPQMNWNSRERRMLRRLVNHDYLQRTVSDIQVIREIYSFLEDPLSWDYHYWLQRGSLEVEVGELALAENFLNSARSLAPKRDYIVETEYAYLTLKKASKRPHAPESADDAESALRELEDIMRQRGLEDSYPFHVYGSQGLSWARRAPMTSDEQKTLLKRLRDAVEKGLEMHPGATALRQLRDDLTRACLMTTVN